MRAAGGASSSSSALSSSRFRASAASSSSGRGGLAASSSSSSLSSRNRPSAYSRGGRGGEDAEEDYDASKTSSSDPSSRAFLKPTKEELLAEHHEAVLAAKVTGGGAFGSSSSASSSSSSRVVGADPAESKGDREEGRDEAISSAAAGAGGGGEGGLLDDDLFSGDVKAVSMIERDELEIPLRKLAWWSALLPQTRGEMLTELGGSYLFFVHGDSLILHLLRKSYVEFSVEEGLQPLVYVHLIERQLSALQSAGAHFHLVFFNIFQHVETTSTMESSSDSVPLAYALIREQLLLHLACRSSSSSSRACVSNSEGGVGTEKESEDLESEKSGSWVGTANSSLSFSVLDDWFGEEWRTLVKARHPTFLLVDEIHFDKEDSEHLQYAAEEQQEQEEEDSEEEEEEGGEEDEEDKKEEEEEVRDDDLFLGEGGRSSLPEEVLLLHEELKKKMKKRGRAWISSLLQSLILSSCSLNVHIALMQGGMYKKTKVFCLAISPTSAVALWLQLEKKRREEEEDRRRKTLEAGEVSGQRRKARREAEEAEKEKEENAEERDGPRNAASKKETTDEEEEEQDEGDDRREVVEREREAENPAKMMRNALGLYRRLLLPRAMLRKEETGEEEEEERRERKELVHLMENICASVPDERAEDATEGGEGAGEEGKEKNKKTGFRGFLRYLLAHRFCYFLKKVAEEEGGEEGEENEESEGRQQLNQFIAIGKMLIMTAMCMDELALQERCHYTVDSARAPFVADYLYAPLTLYYKEALKTLRQLRCMYTSSPQGQARLKQLGVFGTPGSADVVDVCDFFDGKFFFTLLAYACDYARGTNDWVLTASYFGLTPSAQEFLNLSWEGLFRRPSDGEGESGGASASLPPTFLTPFFPIDLSPLSSVLEMYCLPLPLLPSTGKDKTKSEDEKEEENARGGESIADGVASSPGLSVSNPDVLPLHSRFLMRFRAGNLEGRLPAVDVLTWREGQERRRGRRDRRLHQVEAKSLLSAAPADDESQQDQEEEEKEKKMLLALKEEEESKENILEGVENRAREDFGTGPEEEIIDFTGLEVMYVSGRRFEPNEWQRAKMDSMNGEQKKRYLDIIERKSKQRLLTQLRRKARSLCPHPLHYPIVSISDPSHPWLSLGSSSNQPIEDSRNRPNKGKAAEKGGGGGANTPDAKAQKNKKNDEEKKKPLKKADLIRMKNTGIQEKKVQNLDAERLADLEKRLEALCAEYGAMSSKSSLLSGFTHNGTPFCISAGHLHSLLLDVLVGPSRRMSLLFNFPYVTQLLKTRDSQRSFVMKVQRLVNQAYAGFNKESCNSKAHFTELCTLMGAVFRINIEAYRLFKGELEGADIEEIQRSLICLGFPDAAEKIFNEWKKKRVSFLKQKEKDEELAQSQAALLSSSSGGGGHKGQKKNKNEKAKKKEESKKLKAEENAKAKGLRSREEEEEEDEETKQAKALDVHKCSRAAVYDFRVKKGREAHVQLRFMGGDFERTTGSRAKKDSRVCFTPDYWQVHLLDLIDRYESAFVTAPTSSGKTFICYYAMELVLRLSNNATIVYVSPSKALADQVYAEVYGRFSSKTYPSGCKKVLSGEYLLERWTDRPLDAQVLITIPSVLEMLLMSAAVDGWTENLKYVILDEIHCISEEEAGGSRWERLIQMLPCPFLAMSATVGNAESFLYWIRQANPKYPIHHVDYRERFSDLHMVLYHEKSLLPLNPVCSVHYNKVKVEGLASDFYVPPAEGLDVYLVLRKLLGEDHPFSLQFLPSFYFCGSTAITKKQYRLYWNTLRDAFVRLVQTGAIDSSLFNDLQRALQENLHVSWCRDVSLFEGIESHMAAAIKKAGFSDAAAPLVDDLVSSSGAPEGGKKENEGMDEKNKKNKEKENYLETVMEQTEFSKSYLDPDNLIALCRQLDSARLLPCLVFNFFRHEIRKMGVGMSRRLRERQLHKYYGTEEAAYQTRLANKKRLEQYQAVLAQREMEAKLRGLSWQQREAQGIGKDDGASVEDEGIPPPPIDIAEEIDEEFSFASMKAMGMHFDDVKSVIEEVKGKASSPTDHALVDGLRRGVGIYDAGLSRTYREAVDFLFRIGYLRVCICSNALALGMNMPCKTSVFAGDAFVLTPTMFKQSGGRAGRRGFDAVGHILFWEVPFNKINRLLEARLPVFSGDFPVTPMLTLRSMRLYQQIENGPEEEETQVSLQRLFLQPLFSVSADNTKPVPQSLDRLRFYIRFHFRFLCDFLQRLGLLRDGDPETGGGCGLSVWGHMAELSYERETASFFLHFMIYSGLLAEHLWNSSEKTNHRGGEDSPLYLLMHVLAVCISQERVTSGQCLRLRLKHDRVMKRMKTAFDEKTRRAGEREEEDGKILVVSKKSQQKDLSLPNFRPFLPLLPDKVEQASQAYNDLAFSTSVRCLRGACSVLAEREGEHAFSPEEFSLPFTHVNFSRDRSLSSRDEEDQRSPGEKEKKGPGEGGGQERRPQFIKRDASEFFVLYKRLVKRNVVKSPFAAISGKTEDFNDFSCAAEIQDTVRSILPFYPETMCAEIPCNYTWIRYYDEKKKKEVKLKVRGSNSYLLDLLTYRSFRYLTQHNEIGAGRIWFLVSDLVRTLEILAKRSPSSCVDNQEEGSKATLRTVLHELWEEVGKIFKKESA